MKSIVKRVGIILIVTFVGIAVINYMLEYSRFKNFKKSYYITASVALDNAVSKTQILEDGDQFNYNDPAFIRYINLVESSTTDYPEMIKLNPMDYRGSWLRYLGATPVSFGAIYLEKDVLRYYFRQYLRNTLTLRSGQLQNGYCFPEYSNLPGAILSGGIVNNGFYEVDLMSVDVDIEYKVISPTSTFAVDYILGSSNLNSYVTASGDAMSDIIVARVTITYDVCVPYVSQMARDIFNSYGRKERVSITEYFWIVR